MEWISKLQNWEHYGYPLWFVMYEIGFSTLVFFLYQIFAALAWIAQKHYIGQRVHSKQYWVSLAIVFHFCGLIHLTSKLGLVFPELKVFGLFYPVLVTAMACLLFNAFKDLKAWTKIFKG